MTRTGHETSTEHKTSTPGSGNGIAEAIDTELLNSLDEFFAEQLADTASVIETADHETFARYWAKAVELDLPGVGIAESHGGAGGELAHVLAVMQAAGRRCVALPLLEHHLASWLLAQSDVQLDSQLTGQSDGFGETGPVRTVAPTEYNEFGLDGDRLVGTAAQVPWAVFADRIVALVPDETGMTRVVEVDRGALDIEEGIDLAGQPRNTIRAEHAQCRVHPTDLTPDSLDARSTLLRGAMTAGALEALAAQTLSYVKEREQFGQPIGTFQSVQFHVVTVEQVSTAVSISLKRAGAVYQPTDPEAGSFEIDALRLIAFEGVGRAVRAAHQAHGAIGMTREFGLHQITRRLNTWRWDPETPAAAARRLGTAVLASRRMHRTITAPPTTRSASLDSNPA